MWKLEKKKQIRSTIKLPLYIPISRNWINNYVYKFSSRFSYFIVNKRYQKSLMQLRDPEKKIFNQEAKQHFLIKNSKKKTLKQI